MAKYRYTYDAAGNIATKVEPFLDDFNDGNYTDWTLYSTWSASTGEMINTVGSTWRNFYRSVSDADFELRFDYRNLDTSNNGYRLIAELRRSAAGDRVRLSFYPDRAVLQKLVSGVWSDITSNTSATTTQDQTYHVRAVCDGQNVTVWRWQDGQLQSQILNATTTITTTDFVMFGVEPYAHGGFDNIRLVSDSVSNTYTSTQNNANELTAMAVPNGASAMSFGYDAWGRQTSKTQGSYSATYGYRYGSKLYSVTSDFPGEGSVTYNYGGDQKRRLRTVGANNTWYNWGLGWGVLNEESGTGSGTLVKTYVGGMAEIAGSSPATGAYSYYATDNLGSPRAVYDASKALAAVFDFTPYGQAYADHDTVGITHRYTGHDWDATANLYFAPYRFYNPQLARWMSRDPLGMVDGPNVYVYIHGQPIDGFDRLGLLEAECFRACRAVGNKTCSLIPDPRGKIVCHLGVAAACAMACMEPPPDGGGPPADCDSPNCSELRSEWKLCVAENGGDFDKCEKEFDAARAAGCSVQ